MSPSRLSLTAAVLISGVISSPLRNARPSPTTRSCAGGEGRIFSPEVAQIVRRRIAATLRWQEHRREHTLTMLNDEELTAPPLVVGALPPAPASDAMIPWLIELLPAPPAEVEYRRLARDLVIVDRRVNMVVDVLRGAVPLY